MKRTLQFNRTDRDITDAFLKLLLKQPFEKITIQNILDEAMINRSTFYQHFTDKYALLESLQAKYMSELTSYVTSINTNTHNLSLDQIDLLIEGYFVQNYQILRILLKIKTEHFDIVQQMQSYFENYFKTQSNGELSELDANMISCLFVNFLIYYINHDDLSGNYSTIMFNCFLKIAIQFFRLENNESTTADIIQLIQQHSLEKIDVTI